MADASVVITAGSGTSIDTRTEATNGQHRQVVVLGDPSINANVAAVSTQDVASTDQTTAAALIRLAGSATVVGLQGSTARPFIMNTDGAIKVYDLVNGTVGVENVTRVKNLVDGTISVVQRVQNLVDGTVSVVQRVQNVVDGTISTVYRVTNIVDGTISLANIQSTAVVAAAGGSVAGSTSAVSVSGLTIVSPESGRNIKVYAFSLTTTAQVGSQIRFTNGAGTSPTTFWQVALQAPSQGIAGANLAVTPPGYLFATGSNVTLSLLKDTASLLHYSISYFKESA